MRILLLIVVELRQIDSDGIPEVLDVNHGMVPLQPVKRATDGAPYWMLSAVNVVEGCPEIDCGEQVQYRCNIAGIASVFDTCLPACLHEECLAVLS